MEDLVEVDDQLIANKLAEPEWPWIIALAYSAEARAPNAIATVIWSLNHYDEGKTRETATGWALTHLYRLLAGETPKFEWSVIEEIERPIIQAMRAGDIQSFGREEPLSLLQPLEKTVWAGGEIVMTGKSDLKPAGERKSDNLALARQNPNWYYDIHVSASDVRKLVDRETPTALRSIERKSAPPTKRPTTQHRHLFRFFSIMTGSIRNGTRKKAREAYVGWLKNDRPSERPLRREAFERMLEHYKDGWLIKDNEWVLE